MCAAGRTVELVDSPIALFDRDLLAAVALDDGRGVPDGQPAVFELLGNLRRGDGVGALFDVGDDVLVYLQDHAKPPPFKAPGAGCAGMKQHGISFDDHTFERLQAAVGAGHLSPLVREYCWWGLEADAELGRRGILIDDDRERMEFLLDRLEEGLDAWDG